MNVTTRATLEDRMDCLSDYLRAGRTIESDEYADEYKGLEDSLRSDTINEVAERVLTNDYESRDGYHDNRTWRRNVNVDMLAAGKLEPHDPNTIEFGGRPNLVTIDGVKYYSAV
tara:strand:+ start:3808 stop:4149 length:342 start_codon:yes stop_codon:yes gene_type:complete